MVKIADKDKKALVYKSKALIRSDNLQEDYNKAIIIPLLMSKRVSLK
jgi:hypothetical protein